MNQFLTVTGSLGGFVAFIGGVVFIVKAIFRQSNAVAANTTAVENLTRSMIELQKDISQHGERIARLESRR